MDENISYKMCAVKVRNAKLRNYLKYEFYTSDFILVTRTWKLRRVFTYLRSALSFIMPKFLNLCREQYDAVFNKLFEPGFHMVVKIESRPFLPFI
jgi:hypothetical protein